MKHSDNSYLHRDDNSRIRIIPYQDIHPWGYACEGVFLESHLFAVVGKYDSRASFIFMKDEMHHYYAYVRV